MSISQERMITLIDEFANLKTRYNALREELLIVQTHSTDPRTKAYLSQMLARNPVYQSENLAKEQEHFRLRARANQRDADRSRRKRLAMGMEPRRQFASVSDKLKATGIAPQFTPEAWKDIEPMTYEQAVAKDYDPETLYAMFPDQAPKPPSTDIPEDMYKL